IAGVDPADGATAEVGSKIPPTYTAFLKRDGALGRRIGVLRQASRPDASDPQVLRLFDRAIADLRTAGRRSLILSSCQSSTNSRPDSIRSAKFERHRTLSGQDRAKFSEKPGSGYALGKFHPLHDVGLRQTAAAP